MQGKQNTEKTMGRRRFLELSAITTAVAAVGGIVGETSMQDSPEALASLHHPSLPRVDTLIDKNWKFYKGDVSDAQTPDFNEADWSSVTLPHTWNNIDGENGGNYYRGIGWYRLHYTIPAHYTDRQFYLQFDGAALVADVYVNGIHLGQHQGGFTTFRFDATSALKVGANNVIAVKVNNAYETDIPPLNGDFTVFGGLYRDVHLIVTDKVHMNLLDYGSSGLFLRQTHVSSASANLQVTAEAWNDSDSTQKITLNTVILDAHTHVVHKLSSTQSVAAHTGFTFLQNTTIAHPHLWNGQRDPYLYRVYALVQVGSSVKDIVSAPLGFRSYAVDVNNGFFLNGHYLDLHGVNVHQDRPNQGWAISNAEQDEDFRIMTDMGVNFIRTSHYTHAQRLYENADTHGVILWSEQPLLNSIIETPAFAQNAEQQVIEMIRQNYNHPSVIFWSIANEVFNTPAINALLQHLHEVAKAQDPDRLTTLADNWGAGSPMSLHTDVVGYNRYFGWYVGNDASGLNDFLITTHQTLPNQRFGLSEYGAGGSIYQHQHNPPHPTPASYYHPEEWESLIHEQSWMALADKPYVWSKLVWVMFDFASAGRNEGDHPGRNDKGLCTYDRQTKDAYHWYRANWTTKPFVYITERRYVHRTLPTTDIKIYSNMSSVHLTVNGVSLGTRTSTNHIFLWSGVTLRPGNNVVQAMGKQGHGIHRDEATWHYRPDVFIIAGARMPYTAHNGNFYDVDHYYTDGSNGTVTATITGTHDQMVYQTYRYGPGFSYNVPVVNGTYTLTLDFVEPSMTGLGQRVFSVSANGTTIINNLDIYSLVGQNTALQKQFTVTVTNGTLTLNFTASVDNAILSAFSLVHH